MPLSPSGKKILARMIEEYGEKEGKRIFYSKENSDKKFASTVKRHGRGGGSVLVS